MQFPILRVGTVFCFFYIRKVVIIFLIFPQVIRLSVVLIYSSDPCKLIILVCLEAFEFFAYI